MVKQSNKVLVLGSDTRSFLTVIRSLGRAGREVHVAWCARSSPAKTSKYVRHVHDVARPPSKYWVTELIEVLNKEQFDLVIPCNDPSILPLHEKREEFAQFPIYLVDNDIFDLVMDKAAVNEVARTCGLNLPKEVVIRSEDELCLLDQIKPPYVIKPTRSFTSERLSKKNNVAVIESRESAGRQIKSSLNQTPVAVQQFFQGIGVGVEFLASNGKILMAFQHQRLHEPPGGGGSSYRKSCRLNPKLKEATDSLVDALRYSGVGMAEFRYDFNNDDWIFVELNSRFWGSLPLAVACGADFPNGLYEHMCNQRHEFSTEFRVNRSCRNWFMDVQWLRKTIRANGLNIFRQLSLFGQLFSELRFPFTFRESNDTVTRDDPAPGINEIKYALRAIPERIARKFSQYLFSSASYRNWLRQRLLKRAHASSKWMFVCKGNICRSPFAEHYMRTQFEHSKDVASCGYFPKSGRPSPENALIAASKFGIKMTTHQSTEISSEAIDNSDLILVFDLENYFTVRSQFPQARKKTFMLGWLNENGDVEIADPYGGSVERFEQTYTNIRAALDAFSS